MGNSTHVGTLGSTESTKKQNWLGDRTLPLTDGSYLYIGLLYKMLLLIILGYNQKKKEKVAIDLVSRGNPVNHVHSTIEVIYLLRNTVSPIQW